METVQSGRLATSNSLTFTIPDGIVEGSAKVLLKLYPGKASLNSDSAGALLRQPSGCFEQTTASAWPNVMALEMLEGDADANPETVERARAFVSDGYQRILTFQNAAGGFSWWGGNDTPTLAVTALGMMQLSDTSRVHTVDASAIDRAAAWIATQQSADGSFQADTHLHCGNNAIGDSDLRMTAYIAWALAYADQQPATVAAALDSIRGEHRQHHRPRTPCLWC